MEQQSPTFLKSCYISIMFYWPNILDSPNT